MNATRLAKYMKGMYGWESRGMNICFKAPYPKSSQYSDWNKCVSYGAEYMIADRRFGLEYMTMRTSRKYILG